MKEKFALLCAAFSLFAGCAGPIAESGGEPAQASPFTVAAAEPIHELQQMKSITSTPAGVYLTEKTVSNRNTILYYIEADTAFMHPLCGDTACSHNSESCPAWFPDGKNVFLLADGETLYVAEADYNQRQRSNARETDEFPLTIWACSLDGQTRTQIFSQSITQPVETQGKQGYPMPAESLYYDGSYFYADLINYFADEKIFIRIDPATGQYEPVQHPGEAAEQAIEGSSYGYIQGVTGGYLALCCYTKQGDIADCWVSADGSTVFRIDQEIQGSSVYGSDALYWLNTQQPGSTQIMRLAPGEQEPQLYGELQELTAQPYDEEDWRLSSTDQFRYAPYMLKLDCLDNAIVTDYGGQEDQSWLCLPGGKTMPCALHTYRYTSEDTSLKTLAAAGDKLLTALRTEVYSPFYIGYNGEPNLENCYLWQYAFISREDYENQTPGYQLVQRAD